MLVTWFAVFHLKICCTWLLLVPARPLQTELHSLLRTIRAQADAKRGADQIERRLLGANRSSIIRTATLPWSSLPTHVISLKALLIDSHLPWQRSHLPNLTVIASHHLTCPICSMRKEIILPLTQCNFRWNRANCFRRGCFTSYN